MKLWDYHIHLENGPFTLKWLERFLETASKRNLKEIGISEHGYRFKQALELLYSDGFRHEWIKQQATEDINDYINLIEMAQGKGFPIKLGVEMDYTPEKEKEIREFIQSYKWDYVIGSVHWIEDWGFDLPEQKEEWNRRDVNQVYEEYFSRLNSAVLSGIFDIVGHIDVIKIFGYKPDGDISNLLDETLENIKKMDMCIEVSTAGLRKPVGEMYPSKNLLQTAAEKNIPIIINSDAHFPEDVGRDFEYALEYAKSCGCKTIAGFQKRKRIVYNLEEGA